MHGFTFDTWSEDLSRSGEVITDAMKKDEALLQFLTYLKQFDRPMLLGHDIHSFDVPVLNKQFKKLGLMHEYHTVVTRYADTYEMMRSFVPLKGAAENYKLKTLVTAFTDFEHDAHDGLSDAQAAQAVYYARLQGADLPRYLTWIGYSRAVRSFYRAIAMQHITYNSADKLAQIGVSLGSCEQAHEADAVNGLLEHLHSTDHTGRVAIDDVSNVASSLKEFIESEKLMVLEAEAVRAECDQQVGESPDNADDLSTTSAAS